MRTKATFRGAWCPAMPQMSPLSTMWITIGVEYHTKKPWQCWMAARRHQTLRGKCADTLSIAYLVTLLASSCSGGHGGLLSLSNALRSARCTTLPIRREPLTIIWICSDRAALRHMHHMHHPPYTSTGIRDTRTSRAIRRLTKLRCKS